MDALNQQHGKNEIKLELKSRNQIGKVKQQFSKSCLYLINTIQGLKTMNLDPIFLDKAGLREEIGNLLALITLQLDNLP